MPTTPVITDPPNGASGLGLNPRFFGTADAYYSVEIVQANTGHPYGKGVANENGVWAIDIRMDSDQWLTFSARSYVSPDDPNSYSAYSVPITIQA